MDNWLRDRRELMDRIKQIANELRMKSRMNWPETIVSAEQVIKQEIEQIRFCR